MQRASPGANGQGPAGVDAPVITTSGSAFTSLISTEVAVDGPLLVAVSV